jgi:hypothetical protein
MSVLASRTHDKLTNTPERIAFSCGVLRRETLVVMIVATKYNISASLVKIIPKGFDLRGVAMTGSRTEQRPVPVR